MQRKLATRLLGLALAAGAGAAMAAGVPVEHQPGEVVYPAEAMPVEQHADDAPPMYGPPPVAWYARPFMPWHYTGYYVGGGCAFKGSPPDDTQGTWGLDYKGCGCFPRNVWLKWCCRSQGGTGSYKTDGPHVPNVLAFPPHSHGSKEESEHGAEATHEK